MKRFFVLAGIAIVILCQLSCSSDEEQAQIQNPAIVDATNGFNSAPIVGEVKLESMYEDEVRKLARKTPIEMITVIEGTSKIVVEAEFRSVENSPFGFPLYECVLTDEAVTKMGGVASGMSGSPVGTSGRVFGALAYGHNWPVAPHRFWVTPIEAMEATLDHQTFGEFLNPPAAPGAVVNATYSAVKTPITISGVGPDRLQQLSSHLADTQFNNVEFFSRIGGAPGAPPANASPNLSAGDMIGVAAVTGDIVNSMGFGTVTQVYGDKFVAFGHGMAREGKSSLPVYRAVVDGIVPHLEDPYKSTSAYGNPIGMITKDLRAGIVGELGKLPPMIPVTVTYQPVNTPEPVQTHHKVAYGQEWAIPVVAAVTLDAIRSEISPGTIEANVAISFKETDNVYTESFRTIAPDPFDAVLANMDVIVESFTHILANGAGRATIDEINISLIDIPNILHAEIADIHVIGKVKQGEEDRFVVEQGEEVTLVVEMLPHWSATGRNRKMYREVKLQVPDNFVIGPADLSIVAASEFGFNPFVDPSVPPPESLDKLIGQLKDNQFDKGLVLVILAKEEDPPLGEIGIGEFFEEFFEVFFPILLESLPSPEDGETPDEEIAPEDGEIIEVIDEEDLMEELAPTPRPIPITATALLVPRFIVTGDTEVEIEVLPAAVEAEEPEAEVEPKVE